MATHELDNRGLNPPEPMIRTLQKLEEMADGDTLEIHNDRQPMFLYPELDERGFTYQAVEQTDGSYIISIVKKGR